MRLVVGLLVVGALVGGLAWAFPEALQREGAQMSLAYYGLWAALGAGAIAMALRRPWRQTFKYAAVWSLLALILVGIYSFRDEARVIAYRVAGEFVPGLAFDSGKGEVTLRKAQDGHFYAAASINGQKTRLMIDTGASTVVLSAKTAGDVGIAVDKLSYVVPVSTANGRTMTARTTLDSIQIGQIRVNRVSALVARPGDLDVSLLGMSFLGRLEGFEVAGGRMVMRQ